MAMSDQDRGEIDQLGRVIVARESVEGLLQRVADTARQVINRCDSASVSLADEGRVSTWASTDDAAVRVDEHQYGTDEGPCLAAIRTGEAKFVDSLASDERWSEFGPRAVDEGMVSMYSIPLKFEEETVGALNLYSRSKPFAYHDLQAAEALADQAAVTLTNVQAYRAVRDRLEQCEGPTTD
ncbi:MAG: GAF domain-containing protein [Actinomycetota bacterium]|nr:GAF domain-containing protein [Actinomycetota bacterium]